MGGRIIIGAQNPSGLLKGDLTRKLLRKNKANPGPGEYESEPLSLVSHKIKNSYQSVFNSKVNDSKRIFPNSRSNSLANQNISRTAHTSQLSNSIHREGLGLQKLRRKGSEGGGDGKEQFSNTYQYDLSTGDSNELGSLILNSPLEKSQKQAMKLRKGIVHQGKTSPSIPYKKKKKVEVVSPVKYNPSHNLLYKNSP